MDSKTPKANTDERLGLLKSRLKVAQAFVKKPYATMKKWVAEYELEDIENIDEIRDKVRVGYIFRRTESDLPAIFDDQPEIFIKGKGQKYKDLDPFVNNIYDWLWDVQELEEKIDDAGALFVLLGMAFMTSPWETKTKQVLDPQSGQMLTVPTSDQPNAHVENLFKVFPSPETEFNYLMDSEHCPYVFIEHSMSKEEIKSRFGKDIDSSEILHTDNADVNLELDDLKGQEGQKDDIKRSKVYEYWGVLPEEQIADIQGSNWTYDKEYHIFFTSDEELLIEECPYPSKPVMVLGNYGLITKFFRFGEAKHLLPLVQEYEQYRSQILKHTRKMANPKALIPSTAEVNMKDFNDPNVGKEVLYTPGDRGEKPEYLSPATLGSEVGAGIQIVKSDLEQQSAQFSLSSGSTESQVKTPRGIQVFSEAADRNTRRKRKKIARFIRALVLFQFKLCADNLNPQDPKVTEILFGDEEASVDPSLILQTIGDDNILAKVQIEVESLSINRTQIKQDSIELLNTALTSEKLHPGLVNLQEIWKDVIQNGYGKKDADRYLVSLDQMKSQNIQEFIQQIGQVNPELAGQLISVIQSPNMAAIQGQQMPQELQQPQLPQPSQPSQPNQGNLNG